MKILELTRKPQNLLMLMALAMPLSFGVWQALLNNFAIETAGFSGVEIGILQSLREVPGFLAFTAVFILIVLREQTFALLSLVILGMGVSITGFFPSIYGLYFTTVFMSIGFHYFETVQQSLTLQWIPKERAPQILGQLLSVKSIGFLAAYGLVWIFTKQFYWSYQAIYIFGGSLTIVLALIIWILFPAFKEIHPQKKGFILRKRYSLYYALTFMSGARRQVFMVFAGFMMVQKFGFDVATISLLYIVNHLFTLFFAPTIGKLIARFGERRSLTFEYIGLVLVFISYAFVESAAIAVGLYILDHLFFSMGISIKTYFQKIADPADIAASSGVSFTINHIAAIVIPVSFGVLWGVMPSMVFLAGAGMAGISLGLAQLVPKK